MNNDLAERIMHALESLAETAREDLEFRRNQAKAAAEEQRALVERFAGGLSAPTPQATRAQRRGGA